MSAILKIYDERRPGAERHLRHQLELATSRVTARDLIRCRIETEVALHNVAERARRSGDVAAGEEKRDAPNEWLVTPGAVERALNGERPAYGPRPGLTASEIEADPLIAVALEAFARNGFFMIFDGRQITDLDEVLTVTDDSAATFLRLVPLVGG